MALVESFGKMIAARFTECVSVWVCMRLNCRRGWQRVNIITGFKSDVKITLLLFVGWFLLYNVDVVSVCVRVCVCEPFHRISFSENLPIFNTYHTYNNRTFMCTIKLCFFAQFSVALCCLCWIVEAAANVSSLSFPHYPSTTLCVHFIRTTEKDTQLQRSLAHSMCGAHLSTNGCKGYWRHRENA